MNRSFTLALLLVAIAAFNPVAPAQSSPLKKSLAVQLWSFREDFRKDVPGTLRRVRELGFTNVELAGYYGMTAAQFRAELDRAGLRAVSMHIDLETARRGIDQVIADAKILGVRHVGVPWIKSPFTRKDCLDAAEVFNAAGRKLAANGMTFFYHLHGYEFVRDEGGTGTLWDLLMASTDPRYVKIQLDTFHAAHPGQDNVKLLDRYRRRIVSLHLKDIGREVAGDNSGAYREAEERPIGQGRIDWPAVLKAARKYSVQWFIIENETSVVWQQIPASLKYLDGIEAAGRGRN